MIIGEDIRLDRVRLPQALKIKEHLQYYMGKNTPDRRRFIIENLVEEPVDLGARNAGEVP